MSAAHTHTPGPWEFKSDGDWTIVANGDSIMGNTTYYPWVPDKKADWLLIAAAPELLAALIDLERLSGIGMPTNDPARVAARAAIAKAESA